ncbi:MAG TPA: histidine phosphatase family protein [Rhizomicrobium sp.]|nr:histidine phosphatase family protein [Rhizomicrobium sp.]
MKRLLLLRHAKAAQDGGQGDHARPLTPRGEANAARMGHAIDLRGYAPDVVLCSDSRRTVQTWELLAPELGRAPAVDFRDDLYLASHKLLLAAAREAPDEADAAMILGHNPGLEDLGLRLARTPATRAEAAKLEAMREKFPTCALAVLDFGIASWSDLSPGTGALSLFLRPKDLDD